MGGSFSTGLILSGDGNPGPSAGSLPAIVFGCVTPDPLNGKVSLPSGTSGLAGVSPFVEGGCPLESEPGLLSSVGTDGSLWSAGRVAGSPATCVSAGAGVDCDEGGVEVGL